MYLPSMLLPDFTSWQTISIIDIQVKEQQQANVPAQYAQTRLHQYHIVRRGVGPVHCSFVQLSHRRYLIVAILTINLPLLYIGVGDNHFLVGKSITRVITRDGP